MHENVNIKTWANAGHEGRPCSSINALSSMQSSVDGDILGQLPHVPAHNERIGSVRHACDCWKEQSIITKLA